MLILFLFPVDLGQIDCGNPSSSEFVTLSLTNTTYGSEATYNCFNKYHIKSGNLTRYCLSDGTWSGTVPYCARGETSDSTKVLSIHFL